MLACMLTPLPVGFSTRSIPVRRSNDLRRRSMAMVHSTDDVPMSYEAYKAYKATRHLIAAAAGDPGSAAAPQKVAVTAPVRNKAGNASHTRPSLHAAVLPQRAAPTGSWNWKPPADSPSAAPLRPTIRDEVFLDWGRDISQPLDVERPLMYVADDITSTRFNFERWDVHRAPSRYARALSGTLIGVTTRRIFPAVLLLVAISYTTCLFLENALLDPTAMAPQLPLIAFELTAPVLSLLLVFRSDNSYLRFKDGSMYSWEITACLRSYIRRVVVWTGSPRSTAAERETAEEIIIACCLLHQWIMNEYLRPNGPKHVDRYGRPVYEDLLGAALGVAPSAVATDVPDILVGQVPTPYLGLEAIALGATKRLPSLTDQERVGLEEQLGAVASNLAQCEQILRQPIPMGYKRYTIRFLWLWLLLLPFALVPSFFVDATRDICAELAAGTVAVFGVVFLSVEDIAVQIEQPFSILPLDLTHTWMLRDIDNSRRLLEWSAYERGDGNDKRKPIT